MTAMLRPSKPRHSGISFRILALEPRMMFDGAAAGDVADKTAADGKTTDATANAAATTTTDTSAKSAAAAAETDKSAATATVVRWNGQVSTDTTGTRHEVVVVDTTVADWQTLVAGINPNTPIILLSPNADGTGELEVLAQIMKQFHDLDAIHLVAEGRTGAILLGNEVIYSGDMAAASPYLATIGAALKDGGDFMLYSCSVAGSDNGKAFIDSFSRALGNVDVAASTDMTGPTRLGGDWDLEYKTGDIETVLPFTLAGMQDISHCLGCTSGGAKNVANFDSKIYLDGVEIGHYVSLKSFVFNVDVHYSGQGLTSYTISAGTYMSDVGIATSNTPDVIANLDECQVASNTAPTVTAGSSSASYTENGTAVTVDSTITVTDAEQTDLTGATAVISSNFVTGDTLNFTTQNGITGSWNASTHTLTLSGTATKAQYQAALRSITFSSSSDDPGTGNRIITWKVNDGQSSSNLSADGVTSTVHVTAVNDAPTFSTTPASTPTYTESGSAVSLFSGTTISTVESGQNITQVILTVSGLVDGASEILRINGTDVALTNGTSGTSATNSIGYSVSVTGGTATITLTKTDSAANWQGYINALTYKDSGTGAGITDGNRTVTLTSIKDDGGTSNSGVDTKSLSSATTVSVAKLNHAPSLTATTSTPTYTENGTAVSLFSGTSIDIGSGDSSQNIKTLTFTVSNVTDGSSEIVSVDGSDVSLTNGNSVTTATNGYSVSVSVSGGTATITITKSGNYTDRPMK